MDEFKLSKHNFKQEVLDSKTPVLVDFYADWCGPCKMLAPVIDEIKKEYEGMVKVLKVNVDEEEELSAQYGILSIPTLIIFKAGKPVDRLMGLQSKRIITDKLDQLK